MKLNVLERVFILSNLPQKGDRFTLRIIRDIESKIELSQEEIIAHGLKTNEDGTLNFKTQNITDEKEIELTEAEFNQVKDCFKKMDESKEIPKQFLRVIDLFLEEPELTKA